MQLMARNTKKKRPKRVSFSFGNRGQWWAPLIRWNWMTMWEAKVEEVKTTKGQFSKKNDWKVRERNRTEAGGLLQDGGKLFTGH